MRPTIPLIAFLAFSISVSADVTKSPSLAPEDIGAFKWVIGATGNAGEVVILRSSRTWTVGKTKHVNTHDTVSYDPGKRHEGAFVAIDPDYFNPYDKVEHKWHIAPFGGSGWLEGEYAGSSTGDNLGTIKFTNKKGQTYEYRFSAIVMSHQEAVGIYDGLPDDSTTGWKWAGEPKKGDAAQPATDTEESTPAPPKKPLVGKWAGTSDRDNRVVVTFNSDGTFEFLMVDPETPERVKARGTGRYKTDLSVSPAHLDLDMSIEKQKREEPVTHKFKMIFEIIDENSFRMSDLETERPKAFDKNSVVLRRQVVTGAKSN